MRVTGRTPAGLVLAIAAYCVAGVNGAAAADCGLYDYRARIVEVIDGDTVEADIDLGFKVWLNGERLRLIGIDAPETTGADSEKGFASKEALEAKIEGQMVTICTVKNRAGEEQREKYGRWLATIWFDETNVNEWMVNNGHAAPAPQ